MAGPAGWICQDSHGTNIDPGKAILEDGRKMGGRKLSRSIHQRMKRAHTMRELSYRIGRRTGGEGKEGGGGGFADAKVDESNYLEKAILEGDTIKGHAV